jgi:hypothetical protein
MIALAPHSAYAVALATKSVHFNGNNVLIDSFDSSDPTYSTNGRYDAAKTKDGGDVIVVDGVTDQSFVGNVSIYGHLFTSSNAVINLGTYSGAGSHVWLASHTGIEPGWSGSNASYTFPNISFPYNSGLTPQSETVIVPMGNGSITKTYTNVFYSGDYYVSTLTGTSVVLGNARLVVASNVFDDRITMASGARLQIFAGGTSLNMNGNDIINADGIAANFVVNCAPTITYFLLSGNASFTGAIVAPDADFVYNGGGNDTMDFVGALITKSISLNGHINIHYDESLDSILLLPPSITTEP